MERIDSVLKKYYGKISKNFKVAFMSVIVVGLIAHMYMFMNKLPNFDDVIGVQGFGVTFKNGRWFLWVVGAVIYHLKMCFSLPWVNGLTTLILLGIAAGLVADMLRIRSFVGNAILGAAFIAFPSWTGTFFYMFTAPYYGLALLMMVVSVLAVNRLKHGWIPAVVLLACSLGIYQAYLPFTATLYVVLLMMECYDGNLEGKAILRKAFYYLFNLVCGVVVYFVIMKISLAVTGQTLNTYKGISSMGSFDVSRIPDIFSKIVINFFGIFLNNNIEISYNLVTKVMFLVLHIISISFVILQTVRLFRYKDKLKALLYVVFALCYVLAINGIYFMCEDGIYSLMYFSYVFMMILPLCLLDRGFEIYGNGAIVMAEYVTVIFLMAGIACYCHFANGEYLSMDLSYRQAENYYNTLITQIKSTQGYEDTMPIAMVGNEIQDATLYRNDILSDFEMSGRDNSLVDSYSSLYFIKYYCGFDAEYVDISQAGIDQKMVDEMPSYPADGSIKVINGTVVVKFSE